MTTLQETNQIDLTRRRVPPLGGFNATLFGIEMRRLFRNRRPVISIARHDNLYRALKPDPQTPTPTAPRTSASPRC